MSKPIISIVCLSALLLAGLFRWQACGVHTASSQARKVRCYQDSMHPWIKSDQPGKCTVCGMDLTPIYEGQQGFDCGDNVVALSSNSITVLNVQTAEVRRQSLRRLLRVAGTIDANETRKTILAAPASGRIEELMVDYAGVEVHEGQRLLTFYSPELTQQKFRYLLRSQHAHEQRDPTGGLAQQQGDADPYYNDLIAPLSGTVIERNVSKGQYVSEGEKILTIADASVLWFRFDVYEQQLSWLRLKQKVMVSLPALPGKLFEATISFIEPMLDTATRTVKVRADVANPLVEMDGVKQRLFKFGMYAEGELRAEIPDTLAVPRAAVLYPGKAAYAYVANGGGAYERRLITLGRQGDNLWEVRSGLEEGDEVVTSGNVLLDAQAQFNQGGQNDEQAGIAMEPGLSFDEKKPALVLEKSWSNACRTAASASSATHVTNVVVRAHIRGRQPAATPDPIPTGGRRNVESAMYVRMAELRNAELADARAAKMATSSSRPEGPAASE